MQSAKTFLLFISNVFVVCIFAQTTVQQNILIGFPSNLSQAVHLPVMNEHTLQGEGFETLNDLSNRIKYSDIKGSPFWNDEWKLAAIYDNENKFLARVKVKVNFATQEIHFLDKKEQELVVARDIAAKVVMYEGMDTTHVLSVFHNYPDVLIGKKKFEGYLREMNGGKIQLLKLTRKVVASADSLFGTLKTYHFYDKVYYFIRHNDKIDEIKKLNKEDILFFIPNSFQYKEWIEKNKINFRKEEDVIRFLDYYNSSQKNPDNNFN